VVLAFALASGVTPTWRWLQAPLLVGALALLVVGLAMLLSALFVRYRDVKPIWEVVVQLAFYATPVIYAIETIDIDATVKQVLMLSPLAAILQQFRHAVIDPTAPSAAAAAGGGAWVLVPIAITAAVLVLGWRVFDRAAPRIAEEL
jgi:ABC-2 type transport system permease protein